MSRRGATSLAVVALAALALGGCANSTSTGPTAYQVDAGKMGDGIAQHSVEMLAERIPAAVVADSVTYYGGWLGAPQTGRVDIPDQTSLWLDAVITLPQGVGSAIALQMGVTPAAEPDVVVLLDDMVPDCAYSQSYELDEYFDGGSWVTEAWLCAETDQVVVALVQP